MNRFLLALAGLVATGPVWAAPPETGAWVQIWQDEFDTVPADCAPARFDCRKWAADWPVNEHGKPVRWRHDAASSIVADGMLTPRAEGKRDGSVHAGYLTTHKRFGTRYGYFEALMRPTRLKGAQSAFWLQPYAGDGRLVPNNRLDNSANDGAEVDIFESKEAAGHYSAGILCDHYRSWPNVCADTRNDKIPAPGFRDGFHTYALHWTPGRMAFLYDGEEKHAVTEPSRIAHVAERLILSLGIRGGEAGRALGAGSADSSAAVDWVRVHKDNAMDWGTGYFKLVNRETGQVLVGSADRELAVTPDTGPRDDALWQIDKGAGCGEDRYELRPKLFRGYLDVVGVSAALMPGRRACGWSLDFAANEDGKDYYHILSHGPATGPVHLVDGGAVPATAATEPEDRRHEWQIVWVADGPIQ